ncbi:MULTISPECIES: MarR family winged helix-turn-helix transcriptional regulator [unclassified Xanthobacter]|uniref:MarR family winged helix-turn-helix transcriptional regulator n=1 Tax=unclassified Xanthobacter TaxID=2623496 RepID=UPI001EDEFAFE|nr:MULTISPECIES: MarR family transcriptional regulator [unclassified Xanthobacter]
MDNARDVSWVDIDQKTHVYAFTDYMKKVAQARYVIRKVQMTIDDCARKHDLVPLEHQALIQIFGATGKALPVGRIADRLNIVQTLASRLVQQLEKVGLVRRTRSKTDRRATLVHITASGEERLFDIVQDAHAHMSAFRSQVAPEEREAVHEIMAFYVGGIDRTAKPEDEGSPASDLRPKRGRRLSR